MLKKIEILIKKATTYKCPKCGRETEIEFAKFKDLKPTSLAAFIVARRECI